MLSMTSLGLNVRSKSISERYIHQPPIILKMKQARLGENDPDTGRLSLTLSTVKQSHKTTDETPVMSNRDQKGEIRSDVSQYPHLMSFRSTYDKESAIISMKDDSTLVSNKQEEVVSKKSEPVVGARLLKRRSSRGF